METSAKDAVNVEKAFTTLSNEIKSKVQGRPNKTTTGGGKPNSGATLRKETEKKKTGCCWYIVAINLTYFFIFTGKY